MIAPLGFEKAVRWRHEQLMEEAATERLAAEARPKTPGLRHWLATSLYHLAAWLSAGVAEAMADARHNGAGFRTIVNCNGVEYWWPSVGRI